MPRKPTTQKATGTRKVRSLAPPPDQPPPTPHMHADDPPDASATVPAPASSARSTSAVGAAASSVSSPSASVSAPAVAVASASVGSKRKSRAADNAPAAEAAVAGASAVSASSLLQSSEEDQRIAASSQPTAPSAALSAAAPHARLTSAAASLSSSASNAHLASVLESPSAAAPVAKRTRHAAQSAAAAAVHARVSPMIRLLGADSGARQSLLESMELSDIASLQCTGRSWRGWIAGAQSIGAREMWIAGDEPCYPYLCQWLRRSVQALRYQDTVDDDDDPVLTFDQLLLLQWSRLRSLKATLYWSLPRVELLREAFASMAATLQRLDVSLPAGNFSPAVHLLTAISSLPQLESLTIHAPGSWPGLDLSALPTLPRLQQFKLRDTESPCSLAQVEALAQCKSLTDLECGRWLPMLDDPRKPAVQLTDAHLQQLQDGLGRLLRLRTENGAASLRRLELGRKSMILPPCWRVLSQFTALEEIGAWWSCTLTAADWMLLANFPRLRSLTIRNLEREDIGGVSRELLDLGLVLPALVRCRALRSLQLFGVLELRTDHVALLAQVPSLESFEGRCLRIESLEPLSHAPALTELDLFACAGLNGEPINIRAMIPPLPLVASLTIADHWDSRLTAEQAEPFNVILLARLPKLAPERFRQD